VQFLLFIHVLGATVWVGGLITLSLLVPAIRTATEDRAVLRAAARRFNVLSWTALGVQVTTGVWMVLLQFERFWNGTLILKIGLVMLSAMLAAWHTVAARDQSPALRGAIQGIILALALIIVWLALRV
jgi:putative copper export protein